MLGKWNTQSEYQEFVKQKLRDISQSDPQRVLEYQDTISKLYILNTDKLKKVMFPLYSEIGRPAELQPEIFRSFVAMAELDFKLDNWIAKLRNNEVLRTAIGVTEESIPSARKKNSGEIFLIATTISSTESLTWTRSRKYV